MPTIDNISTTATASTVDADDYWLISVDGTVSRISSTELRKVLNTTEEVAVTGATYTLLSTDQGKIVRATNVGAKTFTVPATSGLIIGLPIVVRNASAADITLVADTGVTLNASGLVIGENGSFALIPRATDEWDVYTGDSGGLTQLSTPTLTMVAASDTAMDFSWTNVANESSYEVQIAEDASFTTGVQTATPAADDVAHQFTGLTASTTYYGRVKAVGDGITYSDSAYGTDNEPTSAGGSYDADAQAFFTAAGITDNTQKSAVDAMVVSLKAGSLWTNMKALYPFVGGDATKHSYNLRNTAAYQITWNGGTHSANGVDFNGSSDRGDTGAAAGTVAVNTAVSFGVYAREATANANSYDMGCYSGAGNNGLAFSMLQATDGYILQNTGSAAISGGVANGFIVLTTDVIGNGGVRIFRNGSPHTASGVVTDATVTANYFIGSATASFGYSNRQLALAFIYDGILTPTQVGDLNTIVETFQDALSRGVQP